MSLPMFSSLRSIVESRTGKKGLRDSARLSKRLRGVHQPNNESLPFLAEGTPEKYEGSLILSIVVKSDPHPSLDRKHRPGIFGKNLE